MKKENPFKELETTKEVPDDLKEKVMESISSAKLLAEVGDLFSFKLGNVLGSFFGEKAKEKSDSKELNKDEEE